MSTTTTAATMLSVEGLTAGYGGLAVVDEVSLRIGTGEIVALLGPNGAGKTTTMMTVAGLLPPIAGTVALDGTDITARPCHRLAQQGLAFVPEHRALAPSLTVEENLQLATPAHGQAYEVFPELEPLRQRRAGLLSGGEQQMLAVARALVTEPRIILVDELSLGLAPLLVVRLLERLTELARARGLAVLLVEQHIHQALAFADRAYVMVGGHIALEESADTLRDKEELVRNAYFGTDTTT